MEIYKNILNFEELSSTNAYAHEILRNSHVSEFTTICTQHQTQGKGQRGNIWLTNKNENLTFSIILHPTYIEPTKQFIISQCVSLGIYNMLSKYCKHVSIKWPNDIYVNDKKIAGILIENILSENTIASSIIGIGLNVNQVEFDETLPNPTSMKILCNTDFDLQTILRECILSIYTLYDTLYKDKKTIQDLYIKVLYTFGCKSLFADEKGDFVGEIKSVDETGKICIVDSNLNQRFYYFKEVIYK